MTRRVLRRLEPAPVVVCTTSETVTFKPWRPARARAEHVVRGVAFVWTSRSDRSRCSAWGQAKKSTTASGNTSGAVVMATCCCPGIVISSEPAIAACSRRDGSTRKGGLSPPTKSRVGTLERRETREVGLVGVGDPQSRGMVCAAIRRPSSSGRSAPPRVRWQACRPRAGTRTTASRSPRLGALRAARLTQADRSRCRLAGAASSTRRATCDLRSAPSSVHTAP